MPGARFKDRPGRAQTQMPRAGVFLGEDGKAEPISPAGVFSQAAAVAGKTPQQRRAREFLID
ncbi:hypothetical protein CEK28_04565 [Xenophilus sp. AP218F]|nr:hypothetical protein CEK28_04565 [Xenophilus sp. AP218F]